MLTETGEKAESVQSSFYICTVFKIGVLNSPLLENII